MLGFGFGSEDGAFNPCMIGVLTVTFGVGSTWTVSNVKARW